MRHVAAKGAEPSHRSILTHMTDSIVSTVQKLTKKMRHGYRPEKHYMRGPGPKSRAKRKTQ